MQDLLSNSASPELYLKPGAVVRYTDAGVEKRMGSGEVEAYRLLAEYEHLLQDETVSVLVPRLLSYDEASQTALLTNVGDFSHFSCTEYFGQSDVYTPHYYAAIHRVACLLRNNIPRSAIANQVDYEAIRGGRASSIDYLSSGLTGKEPKGVLELLDIARAIADRTQADIETLPLRVSHRDPNPNNFLIKERNGKYEVAVVDWETFGLSRIGYDEGRAMSYLALDVKKQVEYGEYISRLLPGRRERMYFWRVAANRRVRELISLGNNHYDSRIVAGGQTGRLVESVKASISRGLTDIIWRSVTELSELGVKV